MEFALYHTLGCHLCEIAESVIAEANLLLDSPFKFSYQKVDIADDPQLFEQFGIRIPVLAAASTTATLDWPFDADSVIAFVYGLDSK